MADRNKFEEMLEKLVNEDRKAAEELFHEIVVEKSRTIYENLLENELEETDDEEVDEATDEEVDESDDEEVDESKDEEVDEASDEEVDEATDEEVDEASDEEVEENFDEFTPEADDDMGGDPTDDMMSDIEGGDEEEGGDDEELEDRVVDLEDALDDLKAEFEKMMDGEGGDEDEGEGDDAEMDMGDEEGDEEKEDEAFDASELGVDTQPAFEGEKSSAEQMREYVEKVSEPKGEDNKAKSPVAGKNDMGGTTANIARGSAEEKGGTQGGLANPSTKEDNAGNVNVPGGKASKSMKNQPKGHGAEKKGTGESGVDDKSIIGS
jgi:hypothetical protein